MRNTYKRTSEIKEKMRQTSLKYYQKMRSLNQPFPRKGMHHSPETKEKIREVQIQYNQRLEKEGKQHPQKGRKMSEDAKRKMSESKKGMYDGPKNPAWKGGRKKCGGYIFIWSPYHPYAGKSRYVKENRLVVEKHIGRFLKPEEACHHINGIKDDNRPENLMAFKSDSLHQLFEHGHFTNPSDIIFDGRKL